MEITTSVKGNSKSLTAWFDEEVGGVFGDVTEIVERAVQEGEAITKLNIATRGTLKSGKKGRIETQNMYDSVKSDMSKKGKKEAEGKFGWIDNYQKYFGYQEAGFNHVGGVTVEGMYALGDADREVWDNIQDRVKGVR